MRSESGTSNDWYSPAISRNRLWAVVEGRSKADAISFLVEKSLQWHLSPEFQRLRFPANSAVVQCPEVPPIFRKFAVQCARFFPIVRQARRSSSGIADAPRHRNPIVESLVNRVFARVLSPTPNDRADSHERPSSMAYNQLCLP